MSTISKSKYGIAARKRVFRFLDLPPELRNRIYEYALIHDGEIRIFRHRGAQRGTFHYTGIVSSEVTGRSKPKMRKYYTVKTAALVSVNKFVHKEANPLLYGANRFVFEKTSTLQDLMSGHSGTKHLTNIELVETSLSTNLDVLRKTKSLKRFHIRKIADDCSIEAIARRLVYHVMYWLSRRKGYCRCTNGGSGSACLCISASDAKDTVGMITVDLKGHRVQCQDGSRRFYRDADEEYFKTMVLRHWFQKVEELRSMYKRVHGREWCY